MDNNNATVRLLTIIVFVLAIVATAALTKLFTTDGTSSSGAASLSQNEIEGHIKRYLLETNPGIIIEAYEISEQQKERALTQQAEQNIGAKGDELYRDPETPWFGSDNPDVTIVKFSDYNCGYCKRAFPDLDKLVKDDAKVRVVMKDFPILGPQSLQSSQAALAAWQLDKAKYFAFHRDMMQATPRNDEQLQALAERHGYDWAAFKEVMGSDDVDAKLSENLALGSEIGVRGTPAFIINGEFIRGAVGYDALVARVKVARDNG